MALSAFKGNQITVRCQIHASAILLHTGFAPFSPFHKPPPSKTKMRTVRADTVALHVGRLSIGGEMKGNAVMVTSLWEAVRK